MNGALLENFAVSEIMKGYQNAGLKPYKRIIKTFGVIDKAPLKVGTGAVLCMAERYGAFDRDNLIVFIWMI